MIHERFAAALWGSLLLAAFSMVPFEARSSGRRAQLVAVPFALTAGLLYEWSMRQTLESETVPIRVDLMLLLPPFTFILVRGLMLFFLQFLLGTYARTTDAGFTLLTLIFLGIAYWDSISTYRPFL